MILLESRTNKFYHKSIDMFCFIALTKSVAQNIRSVTENTSYWKESICSKESDIKPVVPNRGVIYSTQGCRELIRFSMYHWKDISKMSPNLKPNCFGCRKLYFSFVGCRKAKKVTMEPRRLLHLTPWLIFMKTIYTLNFQVDFLLLTI